MGKAEPTVAVDISEVQGIDAARAVCWAAENLHLPVKSATITKAKTDLARFGASHVAPLALVYYKYGKKQGTQQTKLLVDLMPKALAIIDKTKASEEQADIVSAEKKSIKELEEFLDEQLQKAGLA